MLLAMVCLVSYWKPAETLRGSAQEVGAVALYWNIAGAHDWRCDCRLELLATTTYSPPARYFEGVEIVLFATVSHACVVDPFLQTAASPVSTTGK